MNEWHSMTGVAAHMLLKYDGNDTDRHIIDAQQYARSLAGAGRLYRLVAHYCIYGEVLTPRKRTDLHCYTAPATQGSYQSTLVLLAAAASEYPVFSDLYKPAVDWLIAKVMEFIKAHLTGSNREQELVDTIKQQAEGSAELSMVLANGLIRANDNLAGLQANMLATLPALVGAAKPHFREAITPVGRSCGKLVQFADTDSPLEVSEPEAMAIRSDEDLVVGKPDGFKLSRIHSLNLDNGACRVSIEGMDGVFAGKIDDIALRMPDNPYSSALNSHSGLSVRARPVYRGDELHRLFITEA
jgi:hypothetical protein